LTLVFGRDGLRFDDGRVPIGANDYALDRYTLDERAGDLSMLRFLIEGSAS
jgi:glucosylceramidase